LNLLELKPIRNVSWDGDAGGRVHLLAPRFGTSLLSWLGVLLRRPTFRVRLDDFGSFVWLRCDGATTVQQIAEALQRQYGAAAEPLYDRLERFLYRLEREGFLSINTDTHRGA
jgi:hypothetical protein